MGVAGAGNAGSRGGSRAPRLIAGDQPGGVASCARARARCGRHCCACSAWSAWCASARRRRHARARRGPAAAARRTDSAAGLPARGTRHPPTAGCGSWDTRPSGMWGMWHAPLPPDPPTTHPPTSLLFRHSNGCVDGCVDVRVDVCACTRACLCVCGCRTHVPSHARTLTRARTHTHTHASHAPRMHRMHVHPLHAPHMHTVCIHFIHLRYTCSLVLATRRAQGGGASGSHASVAVHVGHHVASHVQPRRRLGCAHRGRWGPTGGMRCGGQGLARWAAAGACPALASRKRQRRTDESRPFPCALVSGGLAAAP